MMMLHDVVLGQEKGDRAEDKVQLSCALRVKEMNGSLIPFWNKRFCVLCGSRMFIFASVKPKGKPTLVVDFKGAEVGEYKSKKHFFCLKITTGRHVICLAFSSRMEQSKWLERAEEVILACCLLVLFVMNGLTIADPFQASAGG